MTRIGLLSDTHSYLDPRVLEHFAEVDEIWHAGDIGSEDVLNRLEALKPVRAVFGNIDGQAIRVRTGRHQRFEIEGVSVWITHIGGYPGKYAREVIPEIFRKPPQLFIAGHSHITKVMFDKTLNCLHINPGAAGVQGFHVLRTALRFRIENGKISDMEVFELDRA